MMKITGLSHLFKWENLHNWWLTKYFFAPLYVRCPVNVKKISLHCSLAKYSFFELPEKTPHASIQLFCDIWAF